MKQVGNINELNIENLFNVSKNKPATSTTNNKSKDQSEDNNNNGIVGGNTTHRENITKTAASGVYTASTAESS